MSEQLRGTWNSFGHTVRRHDDSIAKQALQWTLQGCRERGRPRNSWKRDLEKQTWTAASEENEGSSPRVEWSVAYAPLRVTSYNAVVTCKIKLFQSSSTSDWNNSISVCRNLPQIISKLFRKLTCSSRIFSNTFAVAKITLKWFYFSFTRGYMRNKTFKYFQNHFQMVLFHMQPRFMSTKSSDTACSPDLEMGGVLNACRYIHSASSSSSPSSVGQIGTVRSWNRSGMSVTRTSWSKSV